MMLQDIRPHRLRNQYTDKTDPTPDSPVFCFRKADLLIAKGKDDALEEEGLTATIHGKGTYVCAPNRSMIQEEQRRDLERDLEAIPHVKEVLWYDDVVDLTVPVEMIPDDLREKFQQGDCMLSAVFFDEGSSSEETMEAISQVRKVAGEKTFVSGLSAVVTDTRQLVEDQEAIYVAIAVALCAVMLMLTICTSAFAESVEDGLERVRLRIYRDRLGV